MSYTEMMTCPRKAALHSEPLSRSMKTGMLRKIAVSVLLDSSFDIKLADLEKKVDDAFDAAGSKMKAFEFEVDSERKRMKALLNRYIGHESRQARNDILANNFTHEVTVLGEKKAVTAHRLVDRGSAIECIQYRYAAPNLSYGGKLITTKVSMNPDLLALQKCGEIEAAQLGISAGKPVFGSFYFLKSSLDRSKSLSPMFEERKGTNIINYSFTAAEEMEINRLYASAKVDISAGCEDESDCYDCQFADLCHLKFSKRKLEEIEKVEETAIDNIHMTNAQKKFVAFDDGQCRVNAVAGSGKTTIMALRILRLIEAGCKPEHILMVTFTEKAKEEMKSRLRRYANGSALKDLGIDTDKIVVETFNSFGQKLLEEHHDKLGFTEPPTLVDEVYKKDIIAELLNSHRELPMDYNNPFLNLPNASGVVVQTGKLIDAMKASHVSYPADVEELLSQELKPFAKELLEIYTAYNAKLVEKNMLDYEDQLRLLLELKPYGVFEAMPFEHIGIDEFQDSDPNQIGVILEIARADTNLKSIVVVGDELQSIYGFRNANPENLVNFGTYFPGMIDIPLEDNFRSQPPIIAMANRILSKEARIAKVIRANRKEKGLEPVLMNIEKPEEERNLFVRQVKKLVKTGTPAKDIAIFCRTKSELISLQKELNEAGIPTMLRVPEIVAEAPYVKAIISLAAFLYDHSNIIDLALYRKSLGGDPFDIAALKDEAEKLANKYDDLKTEEDRLMLFTGMIQDAREDYIAEAFASDILSRGFHTARELFQYCIKYRDYSIKETKSTVHEDADAVTLITVHSAKGLEWPVVLLSLRKFRVMSEEEHRLLYVAVTRAKEKLLITYGKKQQTLVSLLQ